MCPEKVLLHLRWSAILDVRLDRVDGLKPYLVRMKINVHVRISVRPCFH